MDALIKAFLHVCITVPDLDEALRFYRDVLGFKSVYETRTDKADGKLLGFDEEEIGIYAHHVLTAGAEHGHSTEINLIEYTNPKTIAEEGPYLQMNHVGITRLALLVADVKEACKTIRVHKGVQIVCEPKEIIIREPGMTIVTRWFSFRDPYGVFIAVTEPPKM